MLLPTSSSFVYWKCCTAESFTRMITPVLSIWKMGSREESIKPVVMASFVSRDDTSRTKPQNSRSSPSSVSISVKLGERWKRNEDEYKHSSSNSHSHLRIITSVRSGTQSHQHGVHLVSLICPSLALRLSPDTASNTYRG